MTSPHDHPAHVPLLHIPLLKHPQADDKAVNGSWLCSLAAALDASIKAAAGSSVSAAYASKATNAVAKLRDCVEGRWEGSPWWRMQEGTKLPTLVATCSVTV